MERGGGEGRGGGGGSVEGRGPGGSTAEDRACRAGKHVWSVCSVLGKQGKQCVTIVRGVEAGLVEGETEGRGEDTRKRLGTRVEESGPAKNNPPPLEIRKANAKKKSKSALRADLRVSTITIAYLVVRSPPRR